MIGADRVIVRLETGEYVCADTNSIGSIPYLLGHELEADVVQIFRTFLTPSSAVLDIGANYGFYTAVTASVVKDQGRLYSFEGNPHTFQTLQRTLFASRWHLKPNLVAANVLASDKSGRGILYYTTEALSGATMSDIDLWGGERRSVEVDMTIIDGFLPSDLLVDLVKIDVEGHEPLVIRGMEKTIARSPNIRLIIEFWDALLDYTTGPRNFVPYIHDLGFAMCRTLPQGGRDAERIQPLSPDPYTEGGHGTRTQAEQAARCAL
jgi:FkbM family methyltransferase